MNGKMEIPIAASPNIVLESIRGVLTFDLHSKKDIRRKRVVFCPTVVAYISHYETSIFGQKSDIQIAH